MFLKNKNMPDIKPEIAATDKTVWKCATTYIVSCNTLSNVKLAKKTPVTPPKLNINIKKKIKPETILNLPPKIKRLQSQLKTLTPVGILITIVDVIKNPFKSNPHPTVTIWCPYTKNDSINRDIKERFIPILLNNSPPQILDNTWEITPNTGIKTK